MLRRRKKRTDGSTASIFFLEKKTTKKTKENSYTLKTHTIDLFDLIRSSEMQDYYDGGKETARGQTAWSRSLFKSGCTSTSTAPTTQKNGGVE